MIAVAGSTAIFEGAAEGVHDTVRPILVDLLRTADRPLRLLDAPAGHGAIGAYAAGLGYAVTSIDIDPGVFEPPGMTCIPADLNERLPFADDVFDVVTCVEGIEHVTRQWDVLAEFRRVLRPGGTLIVTTPNVGSIPSRLRFLATGIMSYFDWEYMLREWGHITPITLPELVLALWKAGFSLWPSAPGLDLDVRGTRIKPWARVLSPLAVPIRLVSRRSIRARWAMRLLTSEAALLSEILVIKATAT